jgi:hypothetical protein
VLFPMNSRQSCTKILKIEREELLNNNNII